VVVLLILAGAGLLAKALVDRGEGSPSVSGAPILHPAAAVSVR
jgi:hypothetical protein